MAVPLLVALSSLCPLPGARIPDAIRPDPQRGRPTAHRHQPVFPPMAHTDQ